MLIDPNAPRVRQMADLFAKFAPDYDQPGPGHMTPGLEYEPAFDLADRADLPLVADPAAKAVGGAAWAGEPGRRCITITPGIGHKKARVAIAVTLAIDDFAHASANNNGTLYCHAAAVAVDRLVPQADLARWLMRHDSVDPTAAAAHFGVTCHVIRQALHMRQQALDPDLSFTFATLDQWGAVAGRGRRRAMSRVDPEAPLNPVTFATIVRRAAQRKTVA